MAKAQGRRDRVTEETIEAARAALARRLATPPPSKVRDYSRREAFLKLKAQVREALDGGHPIETVLEDLKGAGLHLTPSTARQYLKPGKKNGAKPGGKVPSPSRQKRNQAYGRGGETAARPDVLPAPAPERSAGTFGVVEDSPNL